MGGEAGKKEDKGPEVITAVYKTLIHCKNCALEIEKPLYKTQGVQKVDIDLKAEKITVKGKIDPKKIHKVIVKNSPKGRIVELVSPLPKKEEKKEEKKAEKKEPEIKIVELKVDIHCRNCEEDIKMTLLELRGVHIVKTDFKKKTCTVEGILEGEKLVKHIRERLNKKAEVVKEEKKENKKEEKKEKEKEKEEEKKIDGCGRWQRHCHDHHHCHGHQCHHGHCSTGCRCVYSYEITSPPHVVYYNVDPHMFNDENPDSCSLM